MLISHGLQVLYWDCFLYGLVSDSSILFLKKRDRTSNMTPALDLAWQRAGAGSSDLGSGDSNPGALFFET